jgi:nicotinate phosphoribosyltransferase
MGRKPAGVRLDSGNLAADSRWVRHELDRAGWKDVKIFASGDLDETKIASLLHKKAAIDAFGVGTALATPGDAPHLNLVYKLVEVERAGKIREAAKLTMAKVTYPGRKQVFRSHTRAGEYAGDKIALDGEPANGGTPLLIEVMRQGRRVAPTESVAELRGRCMAGLARLPQRYRQINRTATYPVHYSKRLRASLENVRRRIRRSALE